MVDKSQAAAAESQADTNEQPARKDPFEGLGTVKLAEATVLDLSGVAISNPRKYAKANETAVAAKLPVMSGWKYGTAVLVAGSVTKEHRAGSVFGTLVDLTKRAGRQGINAYDLAIELRRAQVGNKRSHYCEQVPPVGWAEGYINSAIQQGLINVHATRKAPALVAPAPAPAADSGDGKATGTNG